MKALTVQQPWASAIAAADNNYRGKTTENRDWPVDYQGLVAIHAGKVTDRHGMGSEHVQQLLFSVGWAHPVELPHRAVIAVAYLQDCHRPQRCCWPWGEQTPGVYHWVLTDVIKLPEPVPCRGMVGLFDVSSEVEIEVERLMAVARDGARLE